METIRWLVEQYGTLLFALLLTGALARAKQEVTKLKEVYPHWRRIVQMRKVFGPDTLLFRVRVFWAGGMQAGPTLVGKIPGMRRLALILQQMNAGMFSTLFAGVAYVFDNGGGDGFYTTGANWSPDAPAGGPVAGDGITMNGTSVANLSINTAASVATFAIAAGYTGIVSISAGNSLTTSGALTSATATFTTNNNSVTIGSWSQSGGTVNCGSSTITNNGAYTHSAGTFNRNTSTWVAAGSGTYSGAAMHGTVGGEGAEFASFTINVGVTVTHDQATAFQFMAGNLVLNGTFSIVAADGVWFIPITGANSITIGAGGTITGEGYLVWRGGTSFSIPANATSYTVAIIYVGSNTAANVTVTLTGNFSTTGTLYPSSSSGQGPTTFDCNTYNVSAGAYNQSGAVSATMLWSSGTHTITSFTLTSTTNYCNMGSGSITCSGTWDERSTSASWVVGTATLTFTGASPTWRQDSASNHIYNLRWNGTGTFAPGTGNFRCANQFRCSAATFTPTLAMTIGGQTLIDGTATFNWNNAAHSTASLTQQSGTDLNVSVTDTWAFGFTKTGGSMDISAGVTLTLSGTFTGPTGDFNTGNYIGSTAFGTQQVTIGSGFAQRGTIWFRNVNVIDPSCELDHAWTFFAENAGPASAAQDSGVHKPPHIELCVNR